MARFINNFTNSDLTQATSISSTLSTGNVILFSNDTTLTAYGEDGYFKITSLSEARTHFGTATRTYAMLENLLTNPNGNIAQANGSVFVCKTTSSHATQSKYATDDISANLSTLQAVDDGSFKIVIKEGITTLQTIEYSNIDLTQFTTLAEMATYINSIVDFTFEYVGGKFIITNPIFGAGYTIELEAGTVGTNLIDTDLITIASPVVTAGTDSIITDLKAQFPTISSILVGSLASVPVLTNLDLTATDIRDFASSLQNNFSSAEDIYKHIFFYGFSSLNPLLTTEADYRNTQEFFKTFYVSTPTKSVEALHHLTSLMIAVLRSRDNFQENNPKLSGQGVTLTTSNKVPLVSNLLQVKNYENVGKNLQAKGVTLYRNLGTVAKLSLGIYINGNDKISIEKALFKFDFENVLDDYNVNQIFVKNGNASPSVTMADAIIIANKYASTFLDTLANNKVIRPFSGDVLPFTITDGKPNFIKEQELKSMQNIGFYILPQTISEADKTASRLRFAFLLYTPSGLLKIESTGISFE